ncbi:MAG TPA: hydrogenase maturation protease [Bryobacteraceae bacterium]
MLIIGIGNPDRGDDAAGILVARRLRERGIEAIEHACAMLNLLDLWATGDRVILADAVVYKAAAGSIQVWDPWKEPLQRITFRASTHEFNLADTIELARTLGRLPKWMRIYGIEGRDFEAGTGPCEEVASAADRVAEEIAGRFSARS